MGNSQSKVSKNVNSKATSSNDNTKKKIAKGKLKSEKSIKKSPTTKSKGLKTCGVVYSMKEVLERLMGESVAEEEVHKMKGAGTATVPCNLCCVVGNDGFKYCYDGNEIMLDNYPTSGGPWMPAIYGNGTWTWVNGG